MASTNSSKVGSVMVVGAGIAGVQASLDLANAGYYVYLVEKSSAIGGRMAQLDKTFPTNDCAMCIVSPKLVECGRHLNIEIITNAEVQGMEGEAGDFKIRVAQNPRYIDMEKCTACGDCIEVCPVDVPNEFDQELGTRKATYKRYAQAYPNAYAIDKLDRPPCVHGCPAHLNVQGYVNMAAQGKFQEALEIIMDKLPLPGTLGRVCFHPCEAVCRRQEVDVSLAIRDIKRLAADQFDCREIEVACAPDSGKTVGVVGGGPAGLSAAYHLARRGHKAVIYEAAEKAGGMLRYGIPDYRLPQKVLDQEIEAITNLGVEIKYNSPLGPGLSLSELERDHDAVFLAIGCQGGWTLGIPGEDTAGVIQGVDLLADLARGKEVDLGKKVAVIGGGNVAMDVSRSARRQGAEVTVVYRRTRAEMPAWEEEVDCCYEEGISLEYLAAPVEVMAEGGRIKALKVQKMALGEPDESGRRRPVPIEGSEYEIEVDTVVPAIGQMVVAGDLSEIKELNFKRNGTLEADSVTLATGREGVFAGGDMQVGPWTAIGAVAAGEAAAISIDRMFRGEDLAQGRKPVIQEAHGDLALSPIPESIEPQMRAHMPKLDAEDACVCFDEVEMGLPAEGGMTEAARCLNCGICCECFQCVKACKADAPCHDDKPEELNLNVGSVILAPGFDPFDPSEFDTYVYASHPNVVTSMEFERILSASGPYQGHMQRPSDGVEPKKIAWLQCVGSRDINHCDNGYCSSVCCMYAIKESVIAKEHASGELDAAIFFMDMRTHGKDFEKYYNRAQEEHGVRFIRSRVHTIDPYEGGKLRLYYADESGQEIEEIFDMVVLSVGLQTGPEAVELAKRLDVSLTHYDFAETTSFAPVATNREGVFATGCIVGPKDIPQAVMEASAASCAASVDLAEVRGTLTKEVEYPVEKDITGLTPRVGVFVCDCGINIAGVVDVPAVRDYAATMPYVEYVAENLFTCSQDTQNLMKEIIAEHDLNRIVVASCSPRTHEPLFQETIREAGLNKYLFEMANIRDQDSWVHQAEPDKATAKAKDLVRMAIAKAALIEPLHQVDLDLNKSGLVVGGGVAGMNAALRLADSGYPVVLVEKSDVLGGNAHSLLHTWKGEAIAPYLKELIAKVQAHPLVTVHMESQVKEAKGFVGNFTSTIQNEQGETSLIEHGVAVLATGGQELKPEEYLYSQSRNVMTALEYDQTLKQDPEAFKDAQSFGFIQCVGSREQERPYCSRLCCTHSVDAAIGIKEKNPDARVYIMYRDIRTFGVREDLYRRARELGVLFFRYTTDDKPVVEKDGDGLKVITTDHVLETKVILGLDKLVLAAAVLPNGASDLGEVFKLPLNAEGFFLEAHMKLRPVDFASEGLYLAGLAHYPKPMDETIAQADAAVGRALTVLSKEKIRVGGVVATVDSDKCSVCLTCVRTCPYGVPKVKDGAAHIEVASCYGCGACVAECPGKAISLQHFTDDQILAKERAAFG